MLAANLLIYASLDMILRDDTLADGVRKDAKGLKLRPTRWSTRRGALRSFAVPGWNTSAPSLSQSAGMRVAPPERHAI